MYKRLKSNSSRDLIMEKAAFRLFAISKAFQYIVLIQRLSESHKTLLETIIESDLCPYTITIQNVIVNL